LEEGRRERGRKRERERERRGAAAWGWWLTLSTREQFMQFPCLQSTGISVKCASLITLIQ
jgi:hypothetical protein